MRLYVPTLICGGGWLLYDTPEKFSVVVGNWFHDIRLQRCWGRISPRDAFDDLESLHPFDSNQDIRLCCHLCFQSPIFHNFTDTIRLRSLDMLSQFQTRRLFNFIEEF